MFVSAPSPAGMCASHCILRPYLSSPEVDHEIPILYHKAAYSPPVNFQAIWRKLINGTLPDANENQAITLSKLP